MTSRHRSRSSWLVLAGALALSAGCAHQTAYEYLPTGAGSTGGPAAHYFVPPAAPRGDVYVTSYGITEFDTGGGGTTRLVHARLAVSNGGPGTFFVDGRQQALVAPGLPREGPSFLNTDAGAGPTYQVWPGRANVFDLYFAVPPGLDRPENLGGFALDWTITAGGVAVAERTDFGRFFDESAAYAYADYPPYVTVGLGFGVGWWYGPRWIAFGGPRPIIRGYYFAPAHGYRAAWRGPPPGAWRGGPPGATWRGTPAPAPRGAWRGTPARRAPGGFHRR